MRLLRPVLFAVLLAFSPGCFFFGDGDGVGDFELPIEIGETTVEGSLLGGLLGGLFDVPIALDVDLEAETEARGTGPVQNVYLTRFYLDVTPTAEPAGDSDSLDFIDTVDIFVESTQSGSSLPRQRVATLDGVEDGARHVEFDCDTSIDLLPYINEGARLTAEATGNQPTDDVSFNGLAILLVEVL